MKKIIIFSLIALSSVAANAQVSAKDSIAAVKAAAKAAKAKQAEDLKAFKAKQAEDLKAFIEAQKGGCGSGSCCGKCHDESFDNHDDSVMYVFGIAQSNDLKQYMMSQLNVDTTYMASFIKGIKEAVNADPNDKDYHAKSEGINIGTRIINIAKGVSKDYYAADTTKSADPKLIARGIIMGLLGKTKWSAEDASRYFQTYMAERQKANNERIYGETRRKGEQFLEENKKKEGVVALPSGLQYKVLVAGDEKSERAKKADKVKVNYEGRLIDGTVFDSSYKRGKPTSFQVNQVIKGWTEALMLMPVGAKWEIYIPYQLGYGERGSGGQIKPYDALIFTVELLENETVTKIEADKKEAAAKTTTKKK